MKFTGKCATGKTSFNYSSWSDSNTEVKFAPTDSPMRCSGGVKYDTSSIRPLTPFQNSRLQGYDAFQADKQGSFSLSAHSGEVIWRSSRQPPSSPATRRPSRLPVFQELSARIFTGNENRLPVSEKSLPVLPVNLPVIPVKVFYW